MDMQIRLGDLGFILLGIGLLILIIYAILVLKNLYFSTLSIKKIVEKNEEEIDKIIKQTPSILSNVKDISTEIAYDVKSAQQIIREIIGSTETAAVSIKKNTDILTGIISILQIAYMIKNFITGTKKNVK